MLIIIFNEGVFILPSLKEPWGVVLNEFAASGVPLLGSNVIGASSAFLINGYNGYTFDAGDCESFAQRLLQFINMNDDELF